MARLALMLVIGELQGVPEPDRVEASDVLVDRDRVVAFEQVGFGAQHQRLPDRRPLAACRHHFARQHVHLKLDGEPARDDLGNGQRRIGESQQNALVPLVKHVDQLARLGRQRHVALAGEQVEVRDDDDVVGMSVAHQPLQDGQQLDPPPAARARRFDELGLAPGATGDLLGQVLHKQFFAADQDRQARVQVRGRAGDVGVVRKQDRPPLGQLVRIAISGRHNCA